MKQVIIIVVALGLIILLNYWQCTYLDNTSKYLLADIIHIKNCNEREDFESALSGIDELEKTWNILESSWDIFCDHSNIKEINESILSMKTYAMFKDKEALDKENNVLKYRIQSIINTEKIKLSNIF